MNALRERAFLPALDGHELTAVVPTVTFLVARNRMIMSAPTRVIEQHFVFSILFHTRLINEVCQCCRVFVTPIRNFKSGQRGKKISEDDLQLGHDAFERTDSPFDFPQDAGQLDASLPNPPTVRT